MRDYVNCAECGILLDSDFAVSSKDNEDQLIFFCCDRHKKQWYERDMFARMMDS